MDTNSTKTNYKRCVICQQHVRHEKLQKITSAGLATLTSSMDDRKDEVSVRLMIEIPNNGDFSEYISSHVPKWHGRCRRSYTNQKSRTAAKNLRTCAVQAKDLESNVAGTSSSSDKGPNTRKKLKFHDYKTDCIICSKYYNKKGRKPCSKVMSESTAKSLLRKATALRRIDILEKVQRSPGKKGRAIDMVALDVCYHKECMDGFMNTRSKKGADASTRQESKQSKFDKAFTQLVREFKPQILKDKHVFYLSTLRERYRSLLQEAGLPSGQYHSSNLKRKLQAEFGKRIVFWPQDSGPDLVFNASLKVSDALEKVNKLKSKVTQSQQSDTITKAARLLRRDLILAKKATGDKLEDGAVSIEISREAAQKVIPDSLLRFTSNLVHPKKKNSTQKNKAKSLDLAQQMMFTTTKQPTPLAVGTASHLYNESRSKKLITTMNHLNQSVSYDAFQRYLTSTCEKVIDNEEKEGIYYPPSLAQSDFCHFAIDNVDWHENTQDGSSFHGLSVIGFGYTNGQQCDLPHAEEGPNKPDNRHESHNDETPSESTAAGESQVGNGSSTYNGGKFGIQVLKSSHQRRRSINFNSSRNDIQKCYLSLADRRKARSLEALKRSDIEVGHSEHGRQMHNVWKICRMFPTKLLEIDIEDSPQTIPGWLPFFRLVSPFCSGTTIEYLPLVPAPPNADVVMAGITYLHRLTQKLGMKHTIITADQAIYDIAFGLRSRASSRNTSSEVFDNLILMLGAFHIECNLLKVLGKFFKGSGAEDILVNANIAKKGTANKCFGPSPNYYRAFRCHQVLNEAMSRVYHDAMEEWCVRTSKDLDYSGLLEEISSMANTVHTCIRDDNTEDLISTITQLSGKAQELKQLSDQFDDDHTSRPTFRYWCSYIQMTDLLVRLSTSVHGGLWNEYLDTLCLILPYIVAAKHHNYASSLPLYIKEMKNLPETAPEVHQQFLKGNFVVHRKDGKGNGVSPDMALEQTYNKDAKEKGGLTGITLNEAARQKWVYTKPSLAKLSHQYKEMVGIGSIGETTHHKHDATERKVQETVRVIKSEMLHPFDHTSSNLVNISTGQVASREAEADLTSIREIGEKAINKSLEQNTKKIEVKPLNTFQAKAKRTTNIAKSQKGTMETSILKRILKMLASGQQVHVRELIGSYECAQYPPSLFETDVEGNYWMRHASKCLWVPAILEETGTALVDVLPTSGKTTAYVIDAMAFIQNRPFQVEETFGAYQSRLFGAILYNMPSNCRHVHFTGDRYDCPESRKVSERVRRSKGLPEKIFNVEEHLKTPPFTDFRNAGSNKAALQSFLNESWTSSETQRKLAHRELYLSGGFSDMLKSVCVSNEGVINIPNLSSTQEEADTRVILHAVHSIKEHGAERIVIEAQDTDIIVMCVYYASRFPHTEIYIRRRSDEYIPCHTIASKLGETDCQLHPVLYALSGMDDVSFIRGLGKRKFLKARKSVECNLLCNFGEDETSHHITEELKAQARHVLLFASGGKAFEDLQSCRAHKFLAYKSKNLQALPPTEDSFQLHVRRALLSAMVMKSAHIAKPALPSPECMGWKKVGSILQPVPSSKPAYPPEAESMTSCACNASKCRGRCSCKSAGIPCTITCKCQGKTGNCGRLEEEDNSDGSDNDSDEDDGNGDDDSDGDSDDDNDSDDDSDSDSDDDSDDDDSDDDDLETIDEEVLEGINDRNNTEESEDEDM